MVGVPLAGILVAGRAGTPVRLGRSVRLPTLPVPWGTGRAGTLHGLSSASD